MKNFQVTFFNKITHEEITSYTIEEENKTFARWKAIPLFKKEFKGLEYYTKQHETKRKLIPVQEPKQWEFL